MKNLSIAIVGGGAAGFFAAIRVAEVCPSARVQIFEQGPRVLSKVRISGGGRCNVTNGCLNPQELSRNYPRGGRELLGPLHQFGPRETMGWFESRGVALKTEPDGRVFPMTDNSETIIQCLVTAAQTAGVKVQTSCRAEKASRRAGGGFEIELSPGGHLECDRLMLATGGCRGKDCGELVCALGHELVPPVPSLFTFRLGLPWLSALAGITLPEVEIEVPGTKLRERGPLLITHEGISGPAVLRLSAWGARRLYESDYHFSIRLNWLPGLSQENLAAEFKRRRAAQPSRYVSNSAMAALPGRLWEQLTLQSGIPPATRWADLSSALTHRLVATLQSMALPVSGKSLNRDEFVTCGGVPLREIDFKTMESRICPGLYLGGELLDIDGVTGGFNFQGAWTTGWLAGNGMAC